MPIKRPEYCLVTGGAGYVGSHFCKLLATTTEYTPVVYDNLYRGHRAFVKWGPFEEGDIRDASALDRVWGKYAPTAVFHFAGLTYVGESVYSAPTTPHQTALPSETTSTLQIWRTPTSAQCATSRRKKITST